jgi:hypothetical protein
MGTTSALVALEWPSNAGSVDRKQLSDLGFQLAKHVAGNQLMLLFLLVQSKVVLYSGYAPKYLRAEEVPRSMVDEVSILFTLFPARTTKSNPRFL